MDQSEEYNSGTYDTYNEAVAKCKAILDDFLESAYQHGEAAEQLYNTYVMYGETPVVWGDNLGDFNSNEYARTKCMQIIKLHQQKTKFIGDNNLE